jgi:hypothetical protein
MSNLDRGPSTDASYQVLIHLVWRRQFLFLIGRFKKIFSSETACPNEPKLGRKASMEGPLLRLLILFLLIYNLYKGPSIDVSYQVSIHLTKQFQRRRFKKISQSETRIACGGHVC